MYERNNVMIVDDENVARALFSPKMVVNGILQPEAFKLRSTISEDYLSVMRMSICSWREDIMAIPQHKKRILYGYASLNVGEIRNIVLNGVEFDIIDCSNRTCLSHAGIFVVVNGEKLVGGRLLKSVSDASAQDFLELAIQRKLVDIAQKNVCAL